jgi:hypothetical protein
MVPVSIRITYSDEAPPPTAQINAAVAAALSPLVRAGTPLPGLSDSLWEYFHRRDVTLADASGHPLTPVLIFDQFEELFTLSPTSETSRARNRALLTALAELVENRPPESFQRRLEADPELVDEFEFDGRHYGVLLSLREDYLANLQSFRREIPSVGQYGMRLTGMNGRQAFAAVIEPGRDLVTPAVARHIVQHVASAQSSDGSQTDPVGLASLEVEPSLLSLVCRELNNRRLAGHMPQISAELVAESRDAILRKFYDDALAGQPEGVRQFVEDELLNESGFRESVSLEKAGKTIAARGGAPNALDQLVRRRLLHVEERLGAQRVEITHDVLTKVIRQSREERQEREKALAAAERERVLQEQLRKGRRRTRLISLGLGSAFLLAIGVAVVIFREKQRVDRQNALVAEYVDAAARSLRQNRNEDFNVLYGKWLENTTSFVGQWTAANPGTASAAKLQAVLTANEADTKQQMAEREADGSRRQKYLGDAKAKADSAVQMGVRLAAHWKDADSRKGAAIAVGTAALALKALGQMEGALAAIDTSLALVRSIDRRADSSAAAFEAIFHSIRGDMLAARGKPGDSSHARESYQTSVTLLAPLPPPYGDRSARDELASALSNLGWLEAHFTLLGQARVHYDSAVRVRETMIDSLARAGADARDDLNEQRRRLAGVYLDRTSFQRRLNDTAALWASYDSARRQVEPIATAPDAAVRFKKTYGRALAGLVDIRLARSRTLQDSLGLIDWADSIAVLALAVYQASDDPGEWEDLAKAASRLGTLQMEKGLLATALNTYRGRVQVRRHIALRRRTPEAWADLASAFGSLAYMDVLNGLPDLALAAADSAFRHDSTQIFVWSNVADAHLLKNDLPRAEVILRKWGCYNLGDREHYSGFADAMLDDLRHLQRFQLMNAASRRFQALAQTLAATCTRS